MTEKEFFTETGFIAYCSNFRELKIMYGLKRAVQARFSRFLYIVKLWLLREASIILILTENFEKVPKGSPSRILVWPFVRFAFLKKEIEKFVARMQRAFTNNN